MISKKEINDLDFDDIHDVYQYIVDSKINGNHEQVRSFIKRLSPNQHSNFLLWMQESNIKFEKIYLKWEY